MSPAHALSHAFSHVLPCPRGFPLRRPCRACARPFLGRWKSLSYQRYIQLDPNTFRDVSVDMAKQGKRATLWWTDDCEFFLGKNWMAESIFAISLFESCFVLDC